MFSLRNPSGVEQNLGGILRVVDEDNIELDFGGSIDAGNWSYTLIYFLI